MGSSIVNLPATLGLLVMPSEVIWSYAVGGSVAAIGLIAIFLRGDWRKAPGLDKLILFGPLFYAVPIAAFGTEHFTVAKGIASIVPAWIPWHLFWVYLLGACFIAAALSLVTGIQARLAASLLALTFFLFVALMDAPGWVQNPRDRFALALMLREMSFGAGPLAFAVALSAREQPRGAQILATIARYLIAIAVLYYSLEQFLHGDHVPGIPLEAVTPVSIFGHAIWTYLVAVVYAVAGIMLLAGWKTRTAAALAGLAAFFVVLVVYVQFAVINRTTLEGLNYLFDTLMFSGTVLLLAEAMPRSATAGQGAG